MTGGMKAFVWGFVALWVVLLGWGAKWAFGKWQESSAESARAEAEKWKGENLPMFRVVSMKKRVDRVFTNGEVEIALEGEVEERDSKRHPVYGRAERSEVWVRPLFTTELRGDIGLVPFEPQWVRVREGKGFFTLHKVVEPEVALKLLALWEKITVEGKIQYEK